jgi:hypothetical protein
VWPCGRPEARAEGTVGLGADEVAGAEDVGGAGAVLGGADVDGGVPPPPPLWWCVGGGGGGGVVGGEACGRTGFTAGGAGDPLGLRENLQPSNPPAIVSWLDAPDVLYVHAPPLRADQ